MGLPLLRADSVSTLFSRHPVGGPEEILVSAMPGSSLTRRIGHRDTTGQGDGTMAPIILSARLRGELEDLVLRTPLAKERCRAQAVLWLAEGLSRRAGRRNVPGPPSDRLQLGRPLP